MPVLNLNRTEADALRRYLTKPDGWGISPAEYSPAIANVLAVLGEAENA